MTKLEGVNYIEARNTLSLAFKTLIDDAKQKNGNYIIKKELDDVLKPFMEDPCLHTALPLLKHSPHLLPLFEETKSEIAKDLRDKGLRKY